MLFAPPAWGQVTLEEHGGYSPVTDYNVTWNELDEPWITILQPSNAELGPYDFSCYLTEGEESRPWNIAGISAGESLQGNVELMVRSSWLAAGAANVWRLDVERENVDLTLK